MPANEAKQGKILMETERLVLREMIPADHEALCRIMCDEATMRTAYGRAFSAQEVRDWLNQHMKKYEAGGFGLWAVALRETGEVIGQCGLMPQAWRERQILELGYLFQRAHWHKGYATEAAMACKAYAFSALGADGVYAAVRDTNTASRRVAERIGMRVVDQDVRNLRNVDMNFLLYGVEKPTKTDEEAGNDR